jgi:hypothetical protein
MDRADGALKRERPPAIDDRIASVRRQAFARAN